MQIKSSVIYGIFLSLSSVIFLSYIIGAARYLTDHEENTCDMTYMFEYPQYVRIDLNKKNEEASEEVFFPRYKLYAYGEGFVTERLRRMHFSGIPVLFIPGNAGSHEQVRSLASVSLRKSLKNRTPFHFDYFTISFGKDYSALYGGVLKEETTFVVKCIQKILSLYQGKAKSIILIGHSMGGIIAKGALLLTPEINSKIASILITLATPHQPSIYPDYTFLNYYLDLNNSMEDLKKNGTTVISIGGGPRDILVPSSQTIDEYADINALTTSIPGVWRSTDHLCILWCKQLILKIIRSLFDCVDTSQRPPVITADHKQRMKVFDWHFKQTYSTQKRLPKTPYAEKVDFPNEDSDWIENIQRQYTWSSKTYMQVNSKKFKTVYLMIRVNTPIDTLSIDAIHLKTKDWIFACSASQIRGQSRICSWGWNLSNKTRIVPGLMRKPYKYSVDLDLEDIRTLGASHVVIRIPAQTLNRDYDDDDDDDEDDDEDDDNQIIQVDGYQLTERYKLFSSLKSPWISQPGHLRYHVILNEVTDVVSIGFKDTNCTDNTYSHYSMVQLHEPWVPGSSQSYFFAENEDTQKAIKLQTVNFQRLSLMKSRAAELKMSLDPACSYNIYVQNANTFEKLACMVRDRWTLIYPIIIGLLLLSIGQRIDCQNEERTSATVIIVITLIICQSLNITVECFVGVAILHILALGICCLIVFFGSVAHNIAVRFLARAITFSTTWSNWVLGGLVNQLPVVTAAILLSMIPATCGALSMLLSIFLHFLRLTQMYEDYLEELLLASMRHFNLLRRRDTENETSELTRQHIFNQVLLFLFWCFAALPAVPSALVWAKNFSFSTRLVTEDPVFLYSWIVLVGCGTSGMVQISSISSSKSKILATVLRFLGWIALSLSSTPHVAYYYWCFPPCLAIVAVLIAVLSRLS